MYKLLFKYIQYIFYFQQIFTDPYRREEREKEVNSEKQKMKEEE